jgi:hypothetical protein
MRFIDRLDKKLQPNEEEFCNEKGPADVYDRALIAKFTVIEGTE